MTTFHPHNHPVIPTLTVTIVQHIKLTQRIKPRSYSRWAAELGFHPEQFTHFYLCWSIVRKVQPSSEVYCGALAILSLVVLSVSQSLAKAVWVTTTLFMLEYCLYRAEVHFLSTCLLWGHQTLYRPGYSAFMFNTLIWTKVSHIFPCCRGLWKVYFIICLIQGIFNFPLNHF